ncbi:MAG: HAMP domain-containing protein [Proteobacteria bacterium]|nr:HAMP domain-containing protein [Pseudomonadota bacterium]
MLWKNLKLATKMYISFGGVALIALFLGLFGYYGAERSEQAVHEIGIVRLPSVENLLVIQKNAVALKVVQRTLFDLGLSREERNRQYNDIGKIREEYQAAWQIYEPLPQTPKEAEVWKQFVPAWEQWRLLNNTFFEKMRYLDDLDLGNSLELSEDIKTFIGDHNRLEANILKLIQNGEPFDGGENHTQCNYGKWIANFKTKNPQMLKVIKETEIPHAKTHKSVKQIKKFIETGQFDQAKYVYQDVFVPNMKETLSQFDKILHISSEAYEQLLEIEHFALNDIRAAESKAIDLLGRVVAINKEQAALEVERANHFGERQRQISLIAVVSGTLLAMLIAFLITRAITRSLKNAVVVCEELSRGNLAVDILVDSKDEISNFRLGFCINGLKFILLNF